MEPTEQQRLSHYDINYFIGRACPECMSYDMKILRPGDMGAAVCYAFGYKSYKQVQEVLGIPDGNPKWLPSGDHFSKQMERIRSKATRTPKCVVDIGAGRGELCAAIQSLDTKVFGIDPSPGAGVLFGQTMESWVTKGIKTYSFLSLGMYDGLTMIAKDGWDVDTIIMCESIEHIPEEEFDRAWFLLVEMLKRTSGLLIVTNFINNHPLWTDRTGYDHIRAVDDTAYDKMSSWAKSVAFRQGSHLVLQF